MTLAVRTGREKEGEKQGQKGGKREGSYHGGKRKVIRKQRIGKRYKKSREKEVGGIRRTQQFSDVGVKVGAEEHNQDKGRG